jgi:hypothetical protein
MKKNLLLSLALLAALASGASAASNQSDVVELPTYVVDAPPYSSGVRAVYTSLQAMKLQATAPAAITIELPALNTRVVQATPALKSARLAKN